MLQSNPNSVTDFEGFHVYSKQNINIGGQMAERLGSRAINQKFAGSIPGPTELAPIYATRANLLMQAHSKFDVMLVQEFDS